MTNHATLLRQIRSEARPHIEQWLKIGEVFAGFRKLAADNDLDWGVIKALIKAEVQDEQDEEGGSKRVTKIIDKADCASAYADMLGLGGGEEKNNFSSEPDVIPPHDEDGVIIEPASAPSDAEAGQGGEYHTPSVAPSEEGADAIALNAPSSQLNSEHDAQREATAKTTSPAPAAESPASSQEPCSHGSGAVQDRCESTAPSFPFPCEANGWAGLEPLPQFDRRRPAA